MGLNEKEKQAARARRGVSLDFILTPTQSLAWTTPAREILFGGATRGGKSYFVKVFIASWCASVPGLQVLVLRRYYDDVIANVMEGPDGLKQMLKPFRDAGLVTMTEDQVRWRNGSLITLSHCANDDAAEHAQGIPKNILVIEEAPQLLERHIRFIRGWVTMSEELKGRMPKGQRDYLPKIIYTGNPMGASVGYFRRNFVKASVPNTVFQAPDDDGGFSRIYIPSRYQDNPYEDGDAVRRRVSGMGDAAIAQALLDANWDATIGDYLKMWDDGLHTCPDFDPPSHWYKFVTFDWGSSEPFAVLWWAVADGETIVDKQGQSLWFPRGCLVAYREWYGADTRDGGKGLEMPNKEIADGIRSRTTESWSGLVITDSKPFQATGISKQGRKYNISDEFAEASVPLTLGNTKRIYGWKQLKDRLIGTDGIPMLRVCQSCRAIRDYLPALQRHRSDYEDAEDSGEATHICDCVRYACTTKPRVVDAPPPPPKPKGRNEILTVRECVRMIERKNRARELEE